jgi:hypothetical protein
VIPLLSLTKTQRPSGEVITPNGADGTDVMTGRTPVSVRAGATAALHPGTFSDLAGTAGGKGGAAADGAAGGLGGLAGGGAGAHEASNAATPDVADTASARAIPIFTGLSLDVQYGRAAPLDLGLSPDSTVVTGRRPATCLGAAVDSPEHPAALLPVACTLTATPGAFAERMAEYRRLFQEYLAGRSRTGPGIRFRFRAEPGVEDWVRDLARREKACCAFFDFCVTADGQDVNWDASVADDDAARHALDEFYRLPDTLGADDQASSSAYEPYRGGPSGS